MAKQKENEMGDFIYENIGKVIIAGIGLSVILVYFAAEEDAKTRARMIEQCSPNPEQYECQLYLATTGSSALRRSAQSGAMVGAMLGGGLSRR